MAAIGAVTALWPGTPLDVLWRFKPEARAALVQLGPWGALLMGSVAAACAATATGLWKRAAWGRRLAVAVLALNVVGDLGNALIRGDLRALIGIPIGAALIVYLFTPGVRRQFAGPRNAATV